MLKHNLIIIGGFAINAKIFQNVVDEFEGSLKFVNINTYAEFASINGGVNYLRQYLVAENNIIIGYSMGGLFAISLAHKFPGLISKVGLINSTAKFIQDVGWDGIKLNALHDLKLRLDSLVINQFIRYFISLASYPNFNFKCDFLSLYDGLSKAHLNNLLKLIRYADLRNELKDLKQKIFCINSDKDRLVATNNLPDNCYAHYILDNSTHLNMNKEKLKKILNAEILC